MHSRIYGIIRTQKTNENYEEHKDIVLSLTEYDINETMRSIADYVSEDTDLKDDIKWLKDNHEELEFTSDTTFKINIKKLQEHFENKLAKIKELVNACEIPKDLLDKSYSIKQQLEDEFGFYITDADIYTRTFDEFLEEKYYRLAHNEMEELNEEYEIIKTYD